MNQNEKDLLRDISKKISSRFSFVVLANIEKFLFIDVTNLVNI
jgi:hypothetical protein